MRTARGCGLFKLKAVARPHTGDFFLRVLGAVFNDEKYVFSMLSAALIHVRLKAPLAYVHKTIRTRRREG